MKALYDKGNNLNYKKNHETSSTIDLTEDSDSLMEEMAEAQRLKISKLNASSKNMDVFSVKQLPTLFFLIFIIVLSLLLTKFVPHMYNLSKSSYLYKNKFELKYFPEIIGEQTLPFKVVLIIFIFR
jgi:hypothetical protein